MRRKRLLWQLYPTYLVITVIALMAVTWYSSSSFRRFAVEFTASDLEMRGRLASERFVELIEAEDSEGIQETCRRLSGMTNTRFTVIMPTGEVVGDSETDPEAMDDHGNRPEIMDALDSGRGESKRYSFTLQQNMIYVAIPLKNHNEIVGVLRLSMPTTALDRAMTDVYNHIALGGLVVALLAAGISFWVARRISRQLEQMRRTAASFASGDLTRKMPVSRIRELGDLARTMNSMAEQLYDRMQTVVRQRNEQEAVLASMIEGVLAVDNEARLISMNRAAAELFAIRPGRVQGRTIHENIRHAALLEFVDKTLAKKESGEAEITMFEKEERYLQVHGNVLHDAEGKTIGALFVLNDITRIRRLETVRRDFVANVSHELKTPVTSVKGFVETLLDGAMKDPDTARRFLEIISRHADRLQAIIEDLLSLSRLEQGDQAQIQLEHKLLRPIIDTAVQACELKASAKNVSVTIECGEKISAPINAPILEQAIINLIDNAIKYSNRDSEIIVSAVRNPEHAVIKVIDHGYGIEEKHLDRLFERFYRVDKARSRKLGGTGLGLAIVKHISQIHGGYTTVSSIPGKGSTFSIHIPL